MYIGIKRDLFDYFFFLQTASSLVVTEEQSLLTLEVNSSLPACLKIASTLARSTGAGGPPEAPVRSWLILKVLLKLNTCTGLSWFRLEEGYL